MSGKTPSLTATVESVDDTPVIVLRGALADDGIAVAREAILATLLEGGSQLALRMEGVDYISSSGIGMLVAILKRCRQLDVQLVLVGLDENMRELFGMTRLDQVFTVAGSLDSWRKTLA